jgi:hypothetical protein
MDGWGTSTRAVDTSGIRRSEGVADHHSPGSGQPVDILKLTKSVHMTDAEARNQPPPYHDHYNAQCTEAEQGSMQGRDYTGFVETACRPLFLASNGPIPLLSSRVFSDRSQFRTWFQLSVIRDAKETRHSPHACSEQRVHPRYGEGERVPSAPRRTLTTFLLDPACRPLGVSVPRQPM